MYDSEAMCRKKVETPFYGTHFLKYVCKSSNLLMNFSFIIVEIIALKKKILKDQSTMNKIRSDEGFLKPKLV